MRMQSRQSIGRMAFVCAVALITGCASNHSGPSPAPGTPTERTMVTFADSRPAATLFADVADDDAERSKGLMGVTSLPLDAGMVFLYDAPSTERFWMRDTLIPLSIAFWDERGRVVGLADMRPCAAGEPCPTYGAPSPYIGAVEANLGWFDEHGVEVGDRVDVTECCAS
jgi:uncharacterized membrane protein (UPF0127 family)